MVYDGATEVLALVFDLALSMPMLSFPLTPRLARLAEATLCAVLLFGFATLKYAYDPPVGDGLDGAYYFQIARHVAEGHGFVTSLSIYHMGLAPLPQPAMTYPLLPLLVGELGKFWDVRAMSQLLPEALYLSSLGLCYLWIRTGLRRSSNARTSLAGVAIAALATIWLGLNPVYHWSSSRPYTESLGLTLVFSTLLAYGVATGTLFRSSVRRRGAFFLVGLLAGACYLARFQLAVVVIALLFAQLIGRGKKRFRNAFWIGVGACLPIGLWALRFLSMPNAELRALFDFAAYRQLPALPRFVYTVPCGDMLQCTAEKLEGALEALNPSSKDAYFAQFGAVTYVVPIAAIVLAYRILKHDSPLPKAQSPRHATFIASAWIGILSVLPIHLVHSLYWRTWAFGWRQGLPLLFLLVPASLWLFAGRRAWHGWLVLLVFAGSAVLLGDKTLNLPERDAPPDWLEARAAVAGYLQRVALGGQTLGIEPQPIAAFTDAPLHWVACWSPPELAEILVEQRGVTRAALTVAELGCPSLNRIRARLALEKVVDPGRTIAVFRISRNVQTKSPFPRSRVERSLVPSNP